MRSLASEVAGWVVVVALLGCRPPATVTPAWSTPGHLRVLVIDGGRDKTINYQSHLQHVRGLVRLLGGAGVPASDVSIFASDGADPAPDVALRELQPEPAFWLIAETPAGSALRTPITYANSVVEGYGLQPATRQAITAWFH